MSRRTVPSIPWVAPGQGQASTDKCCGRVRYRRGGKLLSTAIDVRRELLKGRPQRSNKPRKPSEAVGADRLPSVHVERGSVPWSEERGTCVGLGYATPVSRCKVGVAVSGSRHRRWRRFGGHGGPFVGGGSGATRLIPEVSRTGPTRTTRALAL